MRQMMKKNIAVSKETREKIAKLFNVTMRSVWNALNLDYPETDLTKRIRKVAKENGGVVMTSIPAGEAIHFFDGTMRMEFDNGAILEFYRKDGTGHIYVKGAEVEVYENVTLPMIYDIKERAAALR